MAKHVIEQHPEHAIAVAAASVVIPDRASWDAFVLAHPDGHLLQSSGWGALKARFGWKPHLRAVVADGIIRAGALALEKQRFGLSALYLPRGPLFSGDRRLDALLLDDLARLGRRRRAVFVRVEPNLTEDDARAAALHAMLIDRAMHPMAPIQPRSTIHLDLTPEPERLLAGMSKGHRADIKRAAREGVAVREGDPSADLDAFYAIVRETGARARFAIHARAYYASVLELFGDAVRLWLAERDGAPIATAMTATWGTTAIYLYSGSTTKGLQCGAQHAIQWRAIQWARARGAARYDFWGIPDALGQAAAAADPAARARLEAEAEHDPLYGVYRFKKGFGGVTIRYLPAYDCVRIPLLYTLWQRRMHA
ncbi:lipid II:glycine glycyltransferase FemX [Roseiflexus castenholzii]|jgi:lipid II:glycine glycyltransferase (peptidoglycan interpeptide bridge formation enzyme)|uniref:Methicillin resistance protein n=1 Tax=Roseiflexus castenholzii (strain DSM 13941 / HLO8) TaxID=383372 RepID=A7NJ44_ROSCS|nr:peptidoglycan bridge formation glycyltransferase FemA/FemB family protein [Roseiflexus castenholzii]ABU57510.1 Methicillin resistance protein [Roseiflexus castenholzii DSM 13941]